MTRADETLRLVREAMTDPDVSWSIDSFGAIAEFSWHPEEAVAHEGSDRGGRIVTPRGAVSVDLPVAAEALAYEGLSGRADAWTQAVVVTVPEAAIAAGGRDILTELGPDPEAIRDGAQTESLFDMGLGTRNIEVCVRSGDPALVQTLRGAAGRSLLARDSGAMAAIKLASPTRVFRSAAGRIEVYQRIGSRSRDIPTPEGPHTHVLPGLLSRGRTHAATIPVPDGRLPVMTLYPASPVTDEMGRRQPFDAARHARFQAILERLAPEGYVEEKRRIVAAVADGGDPRAYAPADSRLGRLAMKVALRQMVHTGALPGLEAWRRTWDTVEDRADPHAA